MGRRRRRRQKRGNFARSEFFFVLGEAYVADAAANKVL